MDSDARMFKIDDCFTVMSNTNDTLFPDNRIGSFRTKLTYPIHTNNLRNKVALHSIIYPNKIPNVLDGNFRVKAFREIEVPIAPGEPTAAAAAAVLSGAVEEVADLLETNALVATATAERPTTPTTSTTTIQQMVSCNIPSGYYKDPTEIIEKINDQISLIEFTNPVLADISLGDGQTRFSYNQEKVTFSSPNDDFEIRVSLSKDLYVKLGFGIKGDGKSKMIREGTTGEHVCDLNVGLNCLMIYSNIVAKNRIIGDQITNLLAVIPLLGEHNTIAYYEPPVKEYRSISYDVTEEVLIEVRGDTGEIVPFLSGKVILNLNIQSGW